MAMELFYIKGISLHAISNESGYLYPAPNERFADERTCAHVLSLMTDGRLEPKRLVTLRFPYAQLVEVYEMAYRREKNMLGVIFQWNVA